MIGQLLGAFLAALTPEALIPAAAAERPAMTLVVPAYFYPNPAGSDWDRLTRAAQADIAIFAIMNPASGPGDVRDANYTRAIQSFRAAGGRVLGYVPSGYAGRRVTPRSSCTPAAGNRYTADDIVACASRYRNLYRIDGIFVDEMGGEAVGGTTTDVTSFYSSLYDGLKILEPNWHVIGNPGTGGHEHLLRRGNVGAADRLIHFEGLAADFPGAPAASERREVHRYGAHLYGAILIETDPAIDFATALAMAADRNLGMIYVTDGFRPNPYDRLPLSWDRQIDALRVFNNGAKR